MMLFSQKFISVKIRLRNKQDLGLELRSGLFTAKEVLMLIVLWKALISDNLIDREPIYFLSV